MKQYRGKLREKRYIVIAQVVNEHLRPHHSIYICIPRILADYISLDKGNRVELELKDNDEVVIRRLK